MDLPTRTKQKQAESLSYAILLYKLRHLGIFRNVTDNDYGIDFEVELVNGDVVTGAYFKAQVKAARPIKLRGAKQTPVVGGIKQSTLHYWCRLSARSHVIAYAVDIESETVYLSEPVFWAATQLIDGSGASRSLDFVPATPDPAHQDANVVAGSLAFARRPQAPEQIQAIRTALRHLPRFLRQRTDAFARDYASELPGVESFQTMLDVGRILLRRHAESIRAAGLDPKLVYSLDWWIMRSGIDADEVSCGEAQTAYGVLFPLLIERLTAYREIVLKGGYYWLHTDSKFLELVNETTLPRSDGDTLDAWGEDYDKARTPPRESFVALTHRLQKTADFAKTERADKLKARKEKRKQAITSGDETIADRTGDKLP